MSKSTEKRRTGSYARNMRCRRAFVVLPFGLATLALLRTSFLVDPMALSTEGALTHNSDKPRRTRSYEQGAVGSVESEILWERELTPKVVLLASYPNSGTSYTMTLVEGASNVSTASNYGVEVTYKRDDSTPVFPNHPEGPFWDGYSGKLGRKVRDLPTTSVLTKTHCGGRCIKCAADEYVVDAAAFLAACQRTTHRLNGVSMVSALPASAVSGLVHLIRNPYHNVVARFHLERRNMARKLPDLAETYPSNSTGFDLWCDHLDHSYSQADNTTLPSSVLEMFKDVPCRAEFYKWTQWHNLLIEGARQLGLPEDRPVPVHTIHYEDYANNFNVTFEGIMDFLELPIASRQHRTFRDLPTYDDHFTGVQQKAIKDLIQNVASAETWKLIRHYFDSGAPTASE